MKHGKKTAVFLAVFSAFVLSACGGGGSGSAIKPADPGASATYTGKSFYYTNDGATFNNGPDIKTNDINVIVVNGERITLIPDKTLVDANKFYYRYFSGGNATFIGDNLSYARYGTVVSSGTQYLGYFGDATPVAQVPTTGTAQYAGAAMFMDTNGNYHTANSSFNVDFGNKSLNGTINNFTFKGSGDANPVLSAPASVSLSATITGNTFNGTQNGYETHGGFYGPNATELSGIFRSTSTVEPPTFGAFGAKKQ